MSVGILKVLQCLRVTVVAIDVSKPNRSARGGGATEDIGQGSGGSPGLKKIVAARFNGVR